DLGGRYQYRHGERTHHGLDGGESDVCVARKPHLQADAHRAEQERRDEREPDRSQRSARSAAASQRRRISDEKGPTAAQYARSALWIEPPPGSPRTRNRRRTTASGATGIPSAAATASSGVAGTRRS